MSRKGKRALLISSAVAILAACGVLVMTAMRDNIVFFHTPSDIQEGKVIAGQQTRIGGLVEKDSVIRQQDGMNVTFRITDGANAIGVRYSGILPDLFREQQGVVAEGLVKNGTFEATTILAKHDENYMPREVSETLKNGVVPITTK
ncbi:MAG: cytochrome c maturation protein CcmE [Hyphomicrobium sp.]|jgi:cytochrome c-type biogenesis protein CcmE|nr:cytochrome c maturation protein CcmE [Hyphomicrobium sp.]